MWFLKQYEELHILKNEIANYNIESIFQRFIARSKTKGLWGQTNCPYPWIVLKAKFIQKKDEMNINRVYKLVDTCAAEFKAFTPYYYSTFEQ